MSAQPFGIGVDVRPPCHHDGWHGLVAGACGGLLADYLATAEGTADAASAGTLTVAGSASAIRMTLAPQVFDGMIPSGLVRAGFSHPAISDSAVISAPTLEQDQFLWGMIRFESPWGPTLATAGCSGATTRVTELTGGITHGGVGYQYSLTRPRA
ncbi:hypothetical protein OG299_01630 [Streptomyces sp. NBC_01296]|nr:hypothetical protein OG299_01630 [Streptomyces sp. NBC_01296]